MRAHLLELPFLYERNEVSCKIKNFKFWYRKKILKVKLYKEDIEEEISLKVMNFLITNFWIYFDIDVNEELWLNIYRTLLFQV